MSQTPNNQQDDASIHSGSHRSRERVESDLCPDPTPDPNQHHEHAPGQSPHAQPPDDDGDDDLDAPQGFEPQMEDIKIALKFIEKLEQAHLENKDEPLDDDLIHRIRHPPEKPLTIDDPDHRLSLDIFLGITNASEESYNLIRAAILRRHPESDILSYYKVKRLVAELSGVVPLMHDMCINSCIGYTGAFSDLTCCTYCGEDRYTSTGTSKTPRKQFYTMPIALQLQALWRSPDGARKMQYRRRCTEHIIKELRDNGGHKSSPYKDFFDGADYLGAVDDDKINFDDMLLVFSIDGAQLYRNKSSDCWVYIWIILDHAPNTRYKKKHVLIAGIIPGPGKPKNLDSFVYPSLHHLAAIQKEGLRIWDADRDRVFISHPFLALVVADGPGMACLNGFVGHHGKCHCRVYCRIIGRHKPGAPHYYPARMKPHDYSVVGCDHGDVIIDDFLSDFNSPDSTARYHENLLRVINASNKADYERRRLETGICKPSIFSGLPSNCTLPIPSCFGLDIMHLPALNIPDLFIPLWRAKFDCDKTDDRQLWTWAVLKDPAAWKAHGKLVANTTPYIPGSFDRPPRNPAEKISSGYKAWEFLLYFFGLGPCLFYGILPDQYWEHYCKLVRVIRLLMQEEILPQELLESHELCSAFSDDFENLYVQRRADRIHFVRPSIHAISHLAPETARVGPLILSSQWTIERTIGNLEEETKQHSNAFMNLSERALRRCQVNALKAMIPDIEPPEDRLPRGAKDLGDGFVLLTATDNTSRDVEQCEAKAISDYLVKSGQHVAENWKPKVVRWARLRLPNGQVARSRWKEDLKPIDRIRTSRNVKVSGLCAVVHGHY